MGYRGTLNTLIYAKCIFVYMRFVDTTELVHLFICVYWGDCGEFKRTLVGNNRRVVCKLFSHSLVTSLLCLAFPTRPHQGYL